MTAGRAERIAAAAAAAPGVAALSAGPFGTVATYRAGRPVRGVRIGEDEIEVYVVARPDRPVAETAAAVRGAVAPLAAGRPVHVIIGDVAEGEFG